MSHDDWRAETQSRLPHSKIYLVLKSKCESDASGSQVMQLVDDATFYAFQKTKTILKHMGEFTLHDGDHLFRVLTLMEKLISPSSIEKLEIPELLLLILTAFFHDIGMAPEEKAVLSWKKVWDSSPDFIDDEDEEEFRKFQRFCMAKPDQRSQIDLFIRNGNSSAVDLSKSYLIADYIRTTHAERARKIIEKDWLGKIKYRDTDLTIEFANICHSHSEDPLTLLDMEGNYLCGPETYANLQLIAVILRLADLLDFDAKRTPAILYSHLFVRHPISLAEWKKHRAVEAWAISEKKIQFHAKCDHPAIEASIHAFCDVIDNELRVCNSVVASINTSNEKLQRNLVLGIPFRVDRSKIQTKKDIYGNPEYLYRETQFNLSKNQVIDLLMGTKLYGDPEVVLRELIQNSIDACQLRLALETNWENPYEPKIEIKYFREDGEDILEVIDNGTGMDQEIIDSYYSKVGSSFYKSADFYQLKSESGAQFTPTSRFGIGILSCFMVADTVIVDTRRIYAPHNSAEPINLTIEGQESIFWVKPGTRKVPGTSTRLLLRKNKNPWSRLSNDQFIRSVEAVVPNPPFKMLIESENCKKEIDENSFMNLHAADLKDHTWENQDYIREFSLVFSDLNKGFVGTMVIAVLEEHELPVSSIEMKTKTIEIDHESFDLEKSVNSNGNEINLATTSITIDEEGQIERSETYNPLCKSKSRLSLHGIEIPSTLFPDSWVQRTNQVKLEWPFPALLCIDICDKLDLDLNSSRTLIVLSEKWLEFEEVLSQEICSGIARSVSIEYWNRLIEVFKENMSGNKVFIESMEELNFDSLES